MLYSPAFNASMLKWWLSDVIRLFIYFRVTSTSLGVIHGPFVGLVWIMIHAMGSNAKTVKA